MFSSGTSLGVYTVEEVVEGIGFGWFQFAITMFAGATWVRKLLDLHCLIF